MPDRTKIRPLPLLVLLLLAAALILVAIWRQGERTPGGGVSAAATPPLSSTHLEEFAVTEAYTRRLATRWTLADRTDRGRTLRVEVVQYVDEDAARQIIDDGVMSLEALYANALSAYPGDISRRIVAKGEFRPQLFKTTHVGRTHTYFRLFANERLGYGAATDDAVKYKSLLGWFHCAETRLLCKIRLYAPRAAPWEDLEEVLLSLGCQ